MPDYGHAPLFGSFLTPTATDPRQPVELAKVSEEAGLDLVTFQDHPYHAGHLDTWTLLSYVAAATQRVRLAPNVLNVPLRQPAVAAQAAASLDLLSGGRCELALGAGGFWDAIEAMGGRRLSPGQSVTALAEAVEVIRGIWNTGTRTRLRAGGTHHRVAGAKRGPAPAHPIGIWLGAYRPRMLRLVGETADGWLPTLDRVGGTADLAAAHQTIDAAALRAGRDPAAVRRLLNIPGRFGTGGTRPSPAALRRWVEELTALAVEQGFSAFLLMSDDADELRAFGGEVAPAVREGIAAARA